MPSLTAVREALDEFHTALRAALAEPAGLDPRACASLHADVIATVERLTAERDAALALARAVGATWGRIEATSGVADSTLHDRLARRGEGAPA